VEHCFPALVVGIMLGIVIGLVAGLLVGRRNKKVADEVAAAASKLAGK
jgi:ABC-type antimicrobial peptide transport system permease subunit